MKKRVGRQLDALEIGACHNGGPLGYRKKACEGYKNKLACAMHSISVANKEPFRYSDETREYFEMN